MFNFVYKQGWIGKLFLGFLAFSFILGTAIMWGPGSWNFGFGNYLIKVGDITVTPKEFLIELSLERNQNGELPKEVLKNRVYSRLLIRSILAYLAEKDGYYVSDKEIEDFIKRSFVDKEGKFDLKLFENYLKNLGLTANEFKEIVKKILLADHYKRAIFSTTYANSLTLEATLLPFNLKVEGTVYKISPLLFENRAPNPSEGELKKLYEEKLPLLESGNKTVERVLIFKTDTSEEAAKIYKALKEGKTPKEKPFLVVKAGEPLKEGDLKQVVEEALTKKGIVVKKLPDGSYAVAVYRKEVQKVPFEKVKPQLVKLYKEQKAFNYLITHRKEVIKQLLNGTLKVKGEQVSLSGFQLIAPEGWALTFDDLLALLKGKKIFTSVVGRELWILKVEKVKMEDNLSEDIYNSYKNLVRNQDYLNKLGKVVENFLRNHPDEIKINRKLLQQF